MVALAVVTSLLGVACVALGVTVVRLMKSLGLLRTTQRITTSTSGGAGETQLVVKPEPEF